MRTFLLLLLVLAPLACKKDLGVPEAPAPIPPEVPFDHPPVDPPPTVSRGARRLSIAQLRGSIPVLFGNDAAGKPITWSGFTSFPRALGEADFLNTTEDNLEPTPLYMKFMDDLAREVCDKALTADLAQKAPEKRVLLRHVETSTTPENAPDAFYRNLRYLKLRLHGVRVDDQDALTLAPLKALFQQATAANSNQTREGWRAVCVALVVAPEFHAY